jgi:hypothetical protein
MTLIKMTLHNNTLAKMSHRISMTQHNNNQLNGIKSKVSDIFMFCLS